MKLSKFCRTQDMSQYDSLSPEIQEELRIQSIQLLRHHVGLRGLMKKIMSHQGLDDAGRPQTLPKKAHEKGVRSILNKFCIQISGARAGDVIMGASKGTSGAVIRIMKGDIYPEKGKLDLLRQHPDIWNRYMLRLKGLSFFSEMNTEEIQEWLSLHEDSYHNELIVGDSKTQVFLKVLQPGKLVEKINSDDIDILMMGNPNQENGWWTGKEIEDMIPAVPGSKARKHTLALCRFSWKLSNDYELVQTYEGGISDIFEKIDNVRPFFVLKDIPSDFKRSRDSWRPIVQDRISIGIQSPRTPVLRSEIVSEEDLDRIAKIMRNLGPAAYKSLIQKLVRFRPQSVELLQVYTSETSDGGGVVKVTSLVDSLWLLKVAVVKLILTPGSFVPDIQRYVSGKEACFKRLGVIITEDAYASPAGIATCLTAALLSQRVKSWNPSELLMQTAIDAVSEAIQSNKYWDWDWREGAALKPLTIEKGQTALERSSAILTEIRSFQSDIGFLRYIADHPDDIIEGKTDRPEIMPIEHCVDQHWAPNLVYFYDYQLVKKEKGPPGKAFSVLFGKLWDKSSGVNPRKSDQHLDMFEDEFVLYTRRAQNLFLTAKQKNKLPRRIIPDKKHWIDVHLPIGWLAAMVGVIEICGRVTSLVTMSADDPYHLIAVRRPSRNTTDPLTEKQKQTAIEKARNILKRGKRMNSTRPPLEIFEGASIRLIDSGYVIILPDGRKKTWEELADTRISYDEVADPLYHSQLPHLIFETLDPRNMTFREFEWALLFTGNGVVENYQKKIHSAVVNLPSAIVRRVLLYLSTYDTKIEMYPVSREGSGTHQTVTTDDVGAYQSLVMLSALCPAAFTPSEGTPARFDVHSPPLLWHIKEIIQQAEASKRTEWTGNWEPISDSSGRELWTHQREALIDMIENFEAGNKGSFLWLKVGLGKTLIVMYFVKYLIENEVMPPYFVYTLPTSAVDSVLKEIEAFRLPITFLVPLKAMSAAQKKIWKKRAGKDHIVKLGCTPDKFRVNIITTDGHLRKCRRELSEIASEAFLVFDEVHKNMNDSQRTTTAQEIASLANIFAAFTGTPVIDSKTYKLNAWLSRIVPFEVNNNNFLVAANTMITRPINTGIRVETEDIAAVMNEEDLRAYNMLVPPKFGGTNANPVSESWKEAINLCYAVCDRTMVDRTIDAIFSDQDGVMLVARNGMHQTKLRDMLIAKGVPDRDIFVMNKGKSLILTDKTVEEGGPDYRVVITKMSQPEGYTLTRLNVMISSVYPSNRASRVQMEGRINRIGQNKEVYYVKIHTGLLTFILQRHKDAKSLEAALQEVSRHV